MKISLLITTLFFALFVVQGMDFTYAEQFKTFEIEGYIITVDNPHIILLELDWGSGKMPSGFLMFDKVITDKVTLQIPKEMPITVNLDFGYGYYALQSNGHSSLPAKLLESDSFYFLELPVRNSDKITIGSTSPAAGRTVVIEDRLTPVLDNCACQDSGDACMIPRLKFLNSTHYIDNTDCKWRLLPTESDCPSHTKWINGGCVVSPMDRGLFMYDALGPLLLVLLVGMILSPIYAVRKFKKSINKFLFISSVFVAVIILSHVIYGEFFLVGDRGIAPSANESFFFTLSILGSFFVTISFVIFGIIYWRKNKNPNKVFILTFFIIAITPIIALMTGLLPRGANA